MTTTLVRDSIVGDNWLRQTAQAVPVQRVLDKDGVPTGDILTGPVRLSFTDSLFTLPEKSGDSEPKYGCTLLFTPLFDPALFYEEYYAGCSQEFPTYYEPTTQQYHGLHSPFHDQAEKAKYGGYTPGCVFINSSSQYKPPIVDSRHNPIVDQSKVYPGVWAICAVRRYAYGKALKGPGKKGIGFGLQSVMIIGDDTKFGGGAPDTKELFGNVKVSAPIVPPHMAQNMPVAGAPAPAAGIPGYTMPGGGAPARAPFGAPPAGFQQPSPATMAPPAATTASPFNPGEDMSFLD